MGITKTDFMRGMQCERMLWLDRHHPEFKVIPPFVQKRLDRGNEFGDSLLGLILLRQKSRSKTQVTLALT